MRDDWKFSVVDDVQIPCTDNVADFVTFFSVLTHRTHEESFKYLQEASRCLKVGGHVVISFLEFRIPCHWETLIASVKAKAGWTFDSVSRSRRHRGVAGHNGPAVDSFFDGDNG